MPDPLPNLLGVALLGAMVASTVRAFLGEPPRGPRLAHAPVAAGAATLMLAAFVVGAYFGRLEPAVMMAVAGVELGCLAGWLSRADDGGGGGGRDDDHDPDDPDDPSPFDWEEFERELRDYVATPPGSAVSGPR